MIVVEAEMFFVQEGDEDSGLRFWKCGSRTLKKDV